MKRRLEFRLDPDMSKWLDNMAKKPGSSKSAIVEAALKEYLEHCARAKIDPAIHARMNKLSHEMERIA